MFKNGQKVLTDTSLKKIYRWQVNIWKDVQHHMSLGNWEWETVWQFHTKQTILLQYNPVITVLDIYSNVDIYVHMKIWTWTLIST